jgi:hypothetical protein
MRLHKTTIEIWTTDDPWQGGSEEQDVLESLVSRSLDGDAIADKVETLSFDAESAAVPEGVYSFFQVELEDAGEGEDDE